ncbi:hypothetical protein SKAU_G00286540 [Synaphobranchus kaupii]|uniref:Uncharacterized protein n=1 Tax=Synaphobranchus kaupii TaxID=118154 RepID=A0A9Q1EY15_SYNKA|nr:hypothetical protein SKAU_G00286540 [Synaphobranchus kaupii]
MAGRETDEDDNNSMESSGEDERRESEWEEAGCSKAKRAKSRKRKKNTSSAGGSESEGREGLDYINVEMEPLQPLRDVHTSSSDDGDFFSSKSNAQSTKELQGHLASSAVHTDLLKTFSICKHGNISKAEYDAHVKKKDEARQEKSRDKDSANNEKSVWTMDLQAVLLCPKTKASCLYYKTKLQVHNFTLFDLESKEGYCYIWDESEGE